MSRRIFPPILFGTLRRQLIVGVAVVHAVMMTLFIWDLTQRQQALILGQQTEHATALANMLATSAAGWLASNDISGLQELVDAQRRYPDLGYAMLVNTEGQILAHTDKSRVARFVLELDLPGDIRETVLSRSAALVDVIVPAMLADKHVGWARVGIGQCIASNKLAKITRSGVVYALAAIFIGSVIAWFMGRRITWRLYAVQETIALVRAGNRLARSSLEGNDEAAVMAREFNHMLDVIVEKDSELKEKAEELDHYFTDALDLLCIADTEGHFLRLNREWETTLGYPISALEGRCFLDFVHPDDMEATRQTISKLADQKEVLNFTNRYCNNKGEYRWLEWRSFPSGQRIYAVARDITKRKRAEEALRISEQRYRMAQTIGHVGNWEYNVQTTQFWGSHEAKRIYGFDPEQADFSTDEVENCILERDRVHQALIDLIETGKPYNLEFEIHPRNSSESRIISSIAELKHDEHNNPLLVAGIIQDVTDRKHIEQEVERLASFPMLNPQPIMEMDLDGNIYFQNPAVQRLFPDLEHRGTEHPWLADWESLIAPCREKGASPDSREVSIEGRCFHQTIYYAAEEKRLRIYGVEITNRKIAEEALQKSEALLNASQQLSKVGGWEFDVKSGNSFWTKELYRIHEIPNDTEIDHLQESLKCYRPEDRSILGDVFQNACEKGEPYDLELPFTTNRGEQLWIRTTAQPVYEKGKVARLIGNLMDITDRKQAEEDRKAHIGFLEGMDQINHAIRQETNVEKMLQNVVGTVFSIFACDRAWLFYPCDPDAPTFRVPVEICRPEYPGANILNQEVPMIPSLATNLRDVLSCDGPISYTNGTEKPVNSLSSQQFDVQSQMMMAIYPKIGKPWVFGMHQCSHPRIWTEYDQILFQEIGRRVTDGLSNVLLFHDLQESEERYRSLVENLNEVVFALSGTGQITYISPAIENISGFTVKEVAGQSFDLITHPEDLLSLKDYFEKTLAGQLEPFEFRILHKNGTVRWVGTFSQQQLDQGKTTITGILSDITERKRAEEALHRSNRELRAISDCNEILMRVEDEQTLLESVCHIICYEADYRLAWVGYAENDAAKTVRPVAWAGAEDGYLATANITWADTEYGRGPTGIAIRSGATSCIQNIASDPNASPWREKALQRFYRSSIALPLKDENGNVFGVLNIYSTEANSFTPTEIRLMEELAGDLAFGITALRTRAERKRAEEELRRMNERFSLAASAARLGVWDWNIQTNELLWDDGMYTLYGIKREDFTGAYEAWLKGVHPEDRARSDEISRLARTGARDYDTEFRVVWPDGTIHYLKAYGQMVSNADGNFLRMTGINFDITERRQAEEEIRKLNQELEKRVTNRTAQLEEANKELDAFCYSVSHDLRAPLRHIDGYVDLLVSRCRDGLTDKGLYYIDTIADSARQMGILIDDLLQFSRTGRKEIHRESLDMNQVLQEALTPLKETHAERMIVWIIGELPSVRGNFALIRQVWSNLLGNAVKYTRKREVARIEVSARSENDEIIFAVSDNGVGFDMRYVGNLFGVFQRLHSEQDFEGNGIGLATVRRIITRHGGRVWATAELNRGATFYFTLPTSKEEENHD